ALAGDEAALVGELLLAVAEDLLEARVVALGVEGADLAAQEVPGAAEGGGRGGRGGEPVVGPAAVALLLDEAALLEEAQVTGDAGLRDAQDRRELAHVEPLLLQEPEDPQPGLVAQEAEEPGRLFHISKYRYRYGPCQAP